MKKTALVLSGGGFKGAFQLGALEYIKANWNYIDSDHPEMKFDIVAGVSVGALNGLLVAQNEFEKLVTLWEQVAKNGVEEIYRSEFIDTRVNQNSDNPELTFNIDWARIKKTFPNATKNLFLRALFNRKKLFREIGADFSAFKSIADYSPLRNKLQTLAKRDKIKDCLYTCGCVSLNDGKYYAIKHHEFKTDKDFQEAVLASAAMPIVWEPVPLIETVSGGPAIAYAVDGGIRNVSPLGDVIKEISKQGGEDTYTIIIINCNSGELPQEDYREKNIAQIALRALIDVAITEVFNNDIKEFMDKNHLIKQVQRRYPGEVLYDYDYKNDRDGHVLKYFNAIIIEPDEQVLGDTLTANATLIKRRQDHGKIKAEQALKKHAANPDHYKSTISK